jgi:hypothetical protein
MRRQLAFCAILLVGLPVQAEMVASNIPVEVVEVGGHCEAPPDLVLPAPGAGGGKIQRNYGTSRYVVQGDRFPAQVELGIGIRVRMSGYGPGRTVTVRVVPPVGKTGLFDLQIDPDGTLDFGRLPAVGEPLPEGRYLLSALDGERLLFTFAITLDGVVEDSLCVPIS